MLKDIAFVDDWSDAQYEFLVKCLEVFKTQLRALYRASVFGNLGIMFPMITSVSELEKILSICDEVKSELKSQSIEFSDKIELGIMIETPAAGIISDKLAYCLLQGSQANQQAERGLDQGGAYP